LTLNRNDIWKFGTLTATPLEWLEASYFYYRPKDLIWEGNNVRGHYLDKGFNVKFIYRPKNRYFPNFAVGLDDFAGTGLFTREYIVSSARYKNTKFSLGMGWGKFAGDNTISNPLGVIYDGFKVRPNELDGVGFGGTPSTGKWFRGDAAFFGGFEHYLPNLNGAKLKIEYDPFNYFDFSGNNRGDLLENLRKKENDFNIGFSFPVHKFLTIDTSFLKGNTFNITFSLSITFDDTLSKKPKFEPNIKESFEKINDKKTFYKELLVNLNNNRLFLQTANLEDKKLDISISSSEHRNAIRSSSYAAKIANELAEMKEIELNTIKISHINTGIELNNITYLKNHLDEKNSVPIEVIKYQTSIEAGDPNGYLNDGFKPTVNFPVTYTSISPTLLSHIGVPEKFYFGGISLQYINETQFSRNLILSSEINYSLYQNFKDSISGPGSIMEHVRTDLVQYLKEDDLLITRMQLDYIWSPKKEIYSKISGGIFESMYGGFGAEILYNPFNKNFSIGANLFKVKQRSFKQRLNFRDYSTVTGHINFSYLFPLGIESNLSFGRYLAKDDGYTLDLSRTTNSGFKAGVYFTRTNVSAEVFGEGSFDKGFYFQIPMDILTGQYSTNYSSFRLSPLTRDGGAKLIYEKELKGLMSNSSSNDFYNQWNGFLN